MFTGPGLSDHTRGIVTIRQKLVKGKKPFLFFNLWTYHEEFAPLVEQVLSTPVEGFSPPMFRLCLRIFYFTFSQEDGCLLSLPVEAEEMKRTMFSLNRNKAPGPDGYSAHFFKSAWEIVSQDVIEAVKSFFASGKLLREVNSTIMVLVPKVPNPTFMGDFRPISCCNTIYKCITKLIANRINGLLPKIISPTLYVPTLPIGLN
ncbi:hypothetical protein L3X38_040754 [Prunus dulcis]|uniref:Uncharacterized protein n=1 Tax=Prunus dulcis TaxID=3755 RepID=A0AAD4UTF8_PRUDU|nr:hypothetical protein L3X38_040754 [Prunus dulcis]